MTVVARRIDPEVWTKERFLAWAETRPDDVSYEFDGFRPVPIAPATLGHNEIGRNIREVQPTVGNRSWQDRPGRPSPLRRSAAKRSAFRHADEAAPHPVSRKAGVPRTAPSPCGLGLRSRPRLGEGPGP